jgi:hypothetical protein
MRPEEAARPDDGHSISQDERRILVYVSEFRVSPQPNQMIDVRCDSVATSLFPDHPADGLHGLRHGEIVDANAGHRIGEPRPGETRVVVLSPREARRLAYGLLLLCEETEGSNSM